MIQDAARNWVACRRGGGLSDPLDIRPWCSKSVSSASPTSKVVGSYVSTLLGSARASYEVLDLCRSAERISQYRPEDADSGVALRLRMLIRALIAPWIRHPQARPFRQLLLAKGLFQSALGELILIPTEIMTEFVEKGCPDFIQKILLIPLHVFPDIFYEQTDEWQVFRACLIL